MQAKNSTCSGPEKQQISTDLKIALGKHLNDIFDIAWEISQTSIHYRSNADILKSS